MTAPTFSFRDFEHSGWQKSVSAYDRFFGPLTASTADALLDGMNPASDLLDVATGPGYVATKAWRSGANVIGVDFSDEMITRARTILRDQTGGEMAPGLSFEVGDAENLRFAESSFDDVVMNFGVLHLSNPDKAFEEAYRVLRPGGRYAFTAWAQPEEAQGFALMLKCIQAYGDSSVALPPGPPFFRFSDPGESERCLSVAGFRNVEQRTLPLRWLLDSADDLFEAFYAGTARTGGLLRAQTSEALAAIRDAVRKASQAYEVRGKLEIPMPALLVTAKK